jgi:hypothetical protein
MHLMKKNNIAADIEKLSCEQALGQLKISKQRLFV